MSKEPNYQQIDQALINFFKKNAKTIGEIDTIPFSEEQVERGNFKKVAFDLYRVDNDPYQSLWVVEDIDGKPHLVRAEAPQVDKKEAGEWTAVSDYDKQNVTLQYKNVPIARFSSSDYGFDKDDVMVFKKALLESLNEDASFVKDVLLEQPAAKREALVKTFPEFKKFI